MDLVWFLLIGATAGWLAGQIMKGSGYSVLRNVVVGVLGGILGGKLFGIHGIGPHGSLTGSLVTAVIGAVVLLFLNGLITKKKK